MYMLFAQIINQMITDRGIRAVDICKQTGISKASLSKMCSGAVLPASWSSVHAIAQVLQLSRSEYSQLCSAYKEACFQPEMLAADRTVQMLYTLGTGKDDTGTFAETAPLQALSNGTVLHGDDVNAALRTLFRQSAENVRMFSITENNTLSAQFCHLLVSNPSAKNRLLVVLDDKDISAENLQAAADTMQLLFQIQCDVRAVYLPRDGFLKSSPYPLFLAADARLLLLNTEGTAAMYLEGETAAPYLHYFDQKYASGFDCAAVYRSPETFLLDWQRLLIPRCPNDPSLFFAITKTPSIVMEASQDDIRDHISDEQQVGSIAEMFNLMLRNLILNTSSIADLFWREGVDDLLYAPEYYEYGKSISKHVASERRITMFRNKLEDKESDQSSDFGMIMQPYPDSNIVLINLWSDGRMLIMYDTEDGINITVIHEKSTVSTFLAWIRAMQRFGIITKKDETLRFCRAALQAFEAE